MKKSNDEAKIVLSTQETLSTFSFLSSFEMPPIIIAENRWLWQG